MKLPHKKFKFWLIGILIPLLWMGYNAIQIHTFSDTYFETKSDVAIILGAGTSNGKLSPVFRERVNHGVYLYQYGKVAYLIFTGGKGEGQNISDSQVAKDYAMAKGVSPDSIFIEEKSTVTLTNFIYAKELMKQQGFESALIVSDPLHMKRSMTICEGIGIHALPSPTPTTMYRSWKTKSRSLIYESFFYSLGRLVGRYHK